MLSCDGLWVRCSGLEGRQASYVQLYLPTFYLSAYMLDDWKGHRILGVPKKSADNCDAEIILTGLHWCGDERLITTYRYHGIQCVLIYYLLS